MSYDEYRDLKKNTWEIQGNTLGNPKGKVRVFIYGDFMCPFCRIANIMVHRLAKEYNEVYVTHINYPLDSACNPDVPQTVHPNACILARYAIAAKKQNNYWGMVNAIYDNLPNNENDLLKLAKGIGLDEEKLKKDAYSSDVGDELGMQINYASSNNIVATPSFAINEINYIGAMPYYELVERAHQAFRRQERENEQ
jgi:protein-disulfide isomerase